MKNLFSPKLFTLWKAGISKQQILSDSMAGVVVGIVALPLAIAFAVASGVSPEKGLITAVVAGFFISFFGGSRVQIGGPTGAFIVIVYGIVEKYGIDGLMISTMLAGVILIIFGLLKLGSLLKFFPQPLIVGFTSGIALIIFSTQIKDAFGLDIDKVPSSFIGKWDTYISHMHTLNTNAILITIATILITVYSGKFIKKIPGSFIAIILITIVVNVFGIEVNSIETFFGEIPNEISFAVPGSFSLSSLKDYINPAITIALLGAIESLLSAVVADGMISGNHRSNTELIAQGIANIASPFFGGIPATGAIARTATNIKNGGRTPIAGIVHAATLLVIMLFFGKWAKLIPMPCLAGILIVVAYNMSEWRSFVSYFKASDFNIFLLLKSFYKKNTWKAFFEAYEGAAFDIIILLSTFLLTVLIDLTVAIEVGVVLSAILFMKRMSDIAEKRIDHVVDTDIIDDYSSLPKDVSIYEISGPLFFASAKSYAEVIKEIGLKQKTIIIRMRHVSFVDQTGVHNMRGTVKALHQKGVRIILSGVNQTVASDFEKAGLIETIGQKNIFGSFDDAVKSCSDS